MNEANQIKEDSFVKRNHLLEQFADNGIEKAISEEEFSAKYGQGHQIFTMKNINSFVADATKEGASDEIVKGIEGELKTLSKVVVKTATGYDARFVREEKEDLSKGEGSEENTEEQEDNEEEQENTDLSTDDSTVSKGESDFEEEEEA
jgi:hypothetical protein